MLFWAISVDFSTGSGRLPPEGHRDLRGEHLVPLGLIALGAGLMRGRRQGGSPRKP
jgi:hypothetical protein